eukprot:c10361_g1_i1.p1 GENE.c10361_g1_i1~~c10361_g1_i1.p1  ORF type:complete len:316 (+),score=102.52 c10361_g1_i1:47-949(+)
MFEAKLEKGILLKKCLEAIKDLVKQANFECTSSALQLQALDTSHVAMIKMILRSDGFVHYRCDRNVQLGINTDSLSKIFKCADNTDSITLRADDDGDVCTFVFESDKNDRISDFGLKLMSIEEEQVSVPDMDYEAKVTIPSTEFQRICRDLSTIGETITIAVNKTGVHFSTQGDLGTGNITLKQTSAADADDDKEVTIELQEDVTLRFAARYLCYFTKATPLSSRVVLNLAAESPLMVDFKLADNLGCVQYYLAPKVDEEEADDNDDDAKDAKKPATATKAKPPKGPVKEEDAMDDEDDN